MAYNFKAETLFRFRPQDDFEDRIGARAGQVNVDARDDAFSSDETAPVTGNVFADNGSGADSAGKGNLTVALVQGQSMAVGQTITLDSGALLTLNEDGSFSYDQNGAFDALTEFETATDSFTYTAASGRAPLARDQATVTIQINGEANNAAPTITSAATASVAENETDTGYTATATDPDAGDTPVFSITGGADAFLFSIDADTGALTFNSAPDFEAPGDADTDNAYEIQITATDDGGLTDTQAVTVTVTDHVPPAVISLADLDGDKGFRVEGQLGYDYGGFSVSGIGDINGDGFDDVIVSAPGAEVLTINDGEPALAVGGGSSYVVFGAEDGFGASLDPADLDGENGFHVDGVSTFDYSGYSVSGAGDINGDGFDDFIIGAPDASPVPIFDLGASYLVFGSGDGFPGDLDLSTLDGDNGFRIPGALHYDRSGFSVSGAGDINGDGFDDLIIGAPNKQALDPDPQTAGRAYVVFGTDDGFAADFNLSSLDVENGFIIEGVAAYDEAGASVSSAGDINGDGIDDLVVGAPSADPNGESSGSIYVVFGSDAGFGASLNLSSLDGDNGFRIDGGGGYDAGVASVSGAGDVNGDGVGDLLIGAAGANESYVVFGSDAGFGASLDLSSLDGDNGFRLDGAQTVSAAGDFNGDGVDDIIVGARYADPGGLNDAGASYVVFGSDAGFSASLDLAALDGVNGFVIEGSAAGDQSGFSVSAAGDVNGDGFDDIIVGAPGADLGEDSKAGAGYVIFGSDEYGPQEAAPAATAESQAALDEAALAARTVSEAPGAGDGDTPVSISSDAPPPEPLTDLFHDSGLADMDGWLL